MLTPRQQHDRIEKVHGGYTTFIAALVVSFISGDGHIATEWLALPLWILSLPWLVTYLLLDYIVRVRQERKHSFFRGLSLAMGYGTSNLGTTLLLTTYSFVLAGLYVVVIAACTLIVLQVARLEKDTHFSRL